MSIGEEQVPACAGCNHQGYDHCEMCGGKKGTGALPPCGTCLLRGDPPVLQSGLQIQGTPLLVSQVNEDLFDIENGKYRIEKSVITRTDVATKELLDNAVTASHYVVGGRDAIGNIIVLGQEMTYHDWFSNQREWRVYKRVEIEPGVFQYQKLGRGVNPLHACNVAFADMQANPGA